MMHRKLAFVLAASDQGTMIVNRLDYHRVASGGAYGVGHQVLEQGSYDKPEVDFALSLLSRRRSHFGDGVVAVDCGANIGIHTVEWAKRMTGWGSVIGIEAQERVFYVLAGNIALNNCLNARAIHAAVSVAPGTLRVPVPDYLVPASFGSLELRQADTNEFIGQPIDYTDAHMAEIRAISLDSLGLARLDLIKIDVEGMEPEVLDGARRTIEAFKPIVLAEILKTGIAPIESRLSPLGYTLRQNGPNVIAIHASDPSAGEPQAAAPRGSRPSRKPRQPPPT